MELYYDYSIRERASELDRLLRRLRDSRFVSSVSAAYKANLLVLAVDQRQLVNLITSLAHKTDNSKASISIESSASASLGTSLQSPASAGDSLDVEVPRLAVLLASAEHSPSPAFASVEGERDRSSTGTAVGEAGAISELDVDRVEAFGATESDDGCCSWGRGQLGQAAEPGTERTAGEAALAERGRDRPVESGEDGVVVGEDGTWVFGVGVQEVVAVVAEGRCLEVDNAGATVEQLVDGLAGVALGWVVAKQSISACGGVDTVLLKLNPSISQSTLCSERGAKGSVGCAGVSAVGVSKDKDSVADRPLADVVGNLLQVGVASIMVTCFVAVLSSASVPVDTACKTYPASACRLYTSMKTPSDGFQRMNVKPFGVKQSLLEASEQVAHLMRWKPTQL